MIFFNHGTKSLFINLSAKIHEFPLRCIWRQTGYIACAMELTKPLIRSEHFKSGNSNSQNIPRVRQQYEIWETHYLTGFCSYCIEWGNLKCKIFGKKLSHKPYRLCPLFSRTSVERRSTWSLNIIFDCMFFRSPCKVSFFLFYMHIRVTQEITQIGRR